LDEAELLLRQLEAHMAGMHADRFYIEVLALQALLCAQQGRRAQAREALEHAITVAQLGNLQRVFLDLDVGIRGLLAELNLDGERGVFVRQLCAAVDGAESTPVLDPVPQGVGSSFASAPAVSSGAPVTRPVTGTMVQPRHPDLLELLTNREMEVLQLLALRLTNKEIAQALGISTGTVKQHTINLFRKLHVENRREAILQARAMGFQIETPYPL